MGSRILEVARSMASTFFAKARSMISAILRIMSSMDCGVGCFGVAGGGGGGLLGTTDVVDGARLSCRLFFSAISRFLFDKRRRALRLMTGWKPSVLADASLFRAGVRNLPRRADLFVFAFTAADG
jgi:hypothetical protein